MQDATELNKGIPYEPQAIQQGLSLLPAMTARQAVVVADKDAEVKATKYNMELAEAGEKIKWFDTNRKGDMKMTVDEIKSRSFVATEPFMQPLIEAEKGLALAKARYNELVDKFDAVRKMANLLDTEMKTGLGRDTVKDAKAKELGYS